MNTNHQTIVTGIRTYRFSAEAASPRFGDRHGECCAAAASVGVKYLVS